jgi:hypothetical protein
MNKFVAAIIAVGCLLVLGACSSLPSGEPAVDTPIYGSSTPR